MNVVGVEEPVEQQIGQALVDGSRGEHLLDIHLVQHVCPVKVVMEIAVVGTQDLDHIEENSIRR